MYAACFFGAVINGAPGRVSTQPIRLHAAIHRGLLLTRVSRTPVQLFPAGPAAPGQRKGLRGSSSQQRSCEPTHQTDQQAAPDCQDLHHSKPHPTPGSRFLPPLLPLPVWPTEQFDFRDAFLLPAAAAATMTCVHRWQVPMRAGAGDRWRPRVHITTLVYRISA